MINGVSDLDVFYTCKEYGITLFRNEKLHAKCMIAENGDCILGSSNFTKRGMRNFDGANWEINTKVTQVDFKSRALIDTIILESDLIDEEWVKMVKIALDEMPSTSKEKLILPDFKDKSFLISALPMCNHPELLWEIYSEERIFHKAEMNAASHDIALYKLVSNFDSKKDFIKELKINFNSHPFISKLKEKIKAEKSMRYGSVLKWIINNCTQVPIPRSWELKHRLIVNILYDWICYFDDDFSWSRPGHSQVIFHKKESKR